MSRRSEMLKPLPLVIFLVLACSLSSVSGSKDLSVSTESLGVTFPNGVSGVVVYSSLGNSVVNYTVVLNNIQEYNAQGIQVNEYVTSSSKWRNVGGATTTVETDLAITSQTGPLTATLRLRGVLFSSITDISWGTQTTSVAANTLRFLIDIANWPYTSEDNYLVVNLEAYSNKLNTTITNQPEKFTDTLLLQGLAGKDSLLITFGSTVLNSETNDLLSYQNSVIVTDDAHISLKLPSGLTSGIIAMNFQLNNATRVPDAVSVSNERLRAYYQAQLWSVVLSPVNGGDSSSFNIQFVDIKEVDVDGNTVQSTPFSSIAGRWWGPYNVTSSVVSVSSYGTVSVDNSTTTEVALETFTYSSATSIFNLEEQIDLGTNSFKWTLDVINWPFQNDLNTLRITQRVPISIASSVNPTSTGDLESQLRSLVITQQSGSSLLLQYPSKAMVDSTSVNVSVSTALTDGYVDISVTLPRFYSKMSYDPSAQVFESEVEKDIVVTTASMTVSFPAESSNLVVVNFKDTEYSYTLQLNNVTVLGDTDGNDSKSIESTTTFSSHNTVWSGPALTEDKTASVNVSLSLNSSSHKILVITFVIKEADIYWILSNDLDFDDKDVILSFHVLESTSVQPPKVAQTVIDGHIDSVVIRTTPLSSLNLHFLSGENDSVIVDYDVGNDKVSFNLELTNADSSTQFLHLSQQDTRSGGACDGEARIVSTRQIEVSMANGDNGAKIFFAPVPVNPSSPRTVQYTFELISIYELQQNGEKVNEVPIRWWQSSCFGPYNVTIDISHLRAQYSYVFPGLSYPTTIDFNGFLHSEATVVVNQEEEISIEDDSFKFDIDIRSWPFQNKTNNLVLEYQISSSKENRFVIRDGEQPRYILEGNMGHDSLILLLPRHLEVDGSTHNAQFDFTQPDPIGSGILKIQIPYFEKRMFYDPTLQIKHTLPIITRSTDNLVVQMLPNSPSLIVTSEEQLLSVQEYYFQLMDISEITTGPDPVVLQSSNYFKGGWYPIVDEQVNYIGFAELPNNVHVKIGLRTQLYLSGAIVTYGEDTIETRDDSMGVDINVFNWPWVRQSGSQLRIHFRITFFNFLTNETEVWFHKVGSDRFMDYMHVEGGVHNEKIMQIKFPRTAVLDGVNKKLLGSIHIEKSSPSTVELSFLFPHFDEYLEYNPIIYVANPSIEWILGLVLVVIGFTLIMAAYAIVHKIKRYQSLP